MSENNKTHRSIEAIQQEYQQICVKAGHLQYQVVTIQKDLDMVNDSLRELNLEAAAAHAAAPKAAAPKAAAPKAEVEGSKE